MMEYMLCRLWWGSVMGQVECGAQSEGVWNRVWLEVTADWKTLG